MPTISDQQIITAGDVSDGSKVWFGCDDRTGVPYSGRITLNDIVAASHLFGNRSVVVKASGNQAVDAVNLTAAFNAVPQGGIVWIDGMVRVDSNYSFGTKGFAICGIGSDSGLSFHSGGQLNWGSNTSPFQMSSSVLPATAAFVDRFQSPNLTLAVGDYFFVWSDDNITSIPPHFGGGTQHPGELHKVMDFDGLDIFFNDFFVDALQTSPQIVKLTDNMVQGVRVANLRIESAETSSPWLALDYCESPVIEGLVIDRLGPGEIRLRYCMDALVQGCSFGGARDYPDSAGGYCINVVGCNQTLIADNFAKNYRHFVTTAAYGVGNARWGTPRGLRASGNKIACCGKPTQPPSSLLSLDTHREGWGVEFSDNFFTLADGGYAINMRARHCVARNNTFQRHEISENQGWAVNIDAPDCEVVGNVFRGGWCGVDLDSDYAANVQVTHNSFRDVSVLLRHATVSTIQNTRFCSNTAFECGDRTNELLQIDDGSGHEICNNVLNKGSEHPNSIDFGNCGENDMILVGNSLMGYGADDLGLAGTNAAAIQTKFANQNWTD